MALIEQRHPSYRRLMNLWRSRRQGETPPAASSLPRGELADLADVTVRLAYAEPEFRIAESGRAVDALYGAPLTGESAARLSLASGVAELEARTAIETGQPLLIEEELRGNGARHRVARLYLPLSNDDGTPDGVLCGVVAVG